MRTMELYRYNPDHIAPDELDATFVHRESLLEQLIEDLRRQVGAKANQHFLITGPRGVGKTNLLLMLRNRVQADEELRRSYLTLKTAEEEYAITDLLDFFRRILELAVEAAGEQELKLIQAKVAAEKDAEAALENAIQAVKNYSRRSGLKLLLLIDNIDMILEEQFSDEAQLGRFRDILMNESYLVVMGTAPTFFREVSGYERPLYGFFTLKELEELDFEGMVALLRKRAEWENNQALIGRLDTLRPRLRALFHLTGGNPRLVLMLYQILVLAELPEVRSSLEMLLDDMTPYYKHRMESLAPQQRKVMDIFARLGRPATPSELAAEARLPVNQVNSILKRLKESGFVGLAPQERRKSTLYMVSERVFRIWHQMRYSAQGRQRLEFLIEFIRIWYSESDWKEEVGRLRNEFAQTRSNAGKDFSMRHIEHLQYMAAAAPSLKAGYEIEDETIRMCIQSGECKEAETILANRMIEYEREGNIERLSTMWYLKAYACYLQKNRSKVIEALSKAATINPNHHVVFSNWGATISDWARTESGEQRTELFKEACVKYERAVAIKPDFYEAFNNWGNTLSDWARTESGERRTELFKEACVKYERAVAIKPEKHEAFYNWGSTLNDWAQTENDHEKARLLGQAIEKVDAAYKSAVEVHDDSASSFYAAHMAHMLISICRRSIAANNSGDAFRAFSSAIEWLRKADEEKRRMALVSFFTVVLHEKNAELCGMMLEELSAKGFTAESELLLPFREAAHYWESGRDAEVLDRLNPELRKLVEKVISKDESETARKAVPLKTAGRGKKRQTRSGGARQ